MEKVSSCRVGVIETTNIIRLPSSLVQTSTISFTKLFLIMKRYHHFLAKSTQFFTKVSFITSKIFKSFYNDVTFDGTNSDHFSNGSWPIFPENASGQLFALDSVSQRSFSLENSKYLSAPDLFFKGMSQCF